ncbi:ser/Thr protein phosphatase superfamily protein [Coccidioides immitis H538.4]|uniref:Ser/Thr protein phosphatase superfamily protein n=1 Tax=Coccidioides immitis H538.4 TaxID=396776 RepID=A0A0J8UXQ9_COCIT|nr:ser/Thr protein phosphatase superfamily protein [Coccidioides immitis H538.4]
MNCTTAAGMKPGAKSTYPTSGLGTFVFLDHTRHDMPNNIMVLGCTLYSHIPPEHKERVSFSLNDFYLINNWAVKGHNATHAADLMWLNEQVAAISASEPQRKIVIFTHHSPIMQDERAVDPGHIGTGEFNVDKVVLCRPVDSRKVLSLELSTCPLEDLQVKYLHEEGFLFLSTTTAEGFQLLHSGSETSEN